MIKNDMKTYYSNNLTEKECRKAKILWDKIVNDGVLMASDNVINYFSQEFCYFRVKFTMQFDGNEIGFEIEKYDNSEDLEFCVAFKDVKIVLNINGSSVYSDERNLHNEIVDYFNKNADVIKKNIHDNGDLFNKILIDKFLEV